LRSFSRPSRFNLKVRQGKFLKILGGMKVAGEDEKKKTAGGVFLAIIKKSPR
jgi:hypothetical protein